MKTKQYARPGRPAYIPKFPAKLRWTMTDFQIRNGVDPETGKGDNCSKLTLVKWLGKSLANTRAGLVIKLKGQTTHPASDSGLGRKAFLYCLRSRKDELTDKAKPAKPVKRSIATVKSNVSVKLAAPAPADYEATKAALLAPTPTPVVAEVTEPVAAPVVTETAPTPIAEAPAAAPAPETVNA